MSLQSNGKFYAQIRYGKGRRKAFLLPHAADKPTADARELQCRSAVLTLVKAGLLHEVDRFARGVAEAKSEREVLPWTIAAERLAATAPPTLAGELTFEEFAGHWTSGKLHLDYPDRVRKKNSRGDRFILNNHVNPKIGQLPLTSVREEHCEQVLRGLPADLSPATRRHVAQVISRVLKLATFPARRIKVYPLPPNWMPHLAKPREKPWLYPDEERKLLACTAIPLGRRVLYGFLTREGLRYSEAIALDLADLDLEHGVIRLEANKTDDPRAWALDPEVCRVLEKWQWKFEPIHHPASTLREDLLTAGVTRHELHHDTERRKRMGIHELRGTFVTLSLANGRTETWVQDRTGHKSTLMINRYRRAARTLVEIKGGSLASMWQVLKGELLQLSK